MHHKDIKLIARKQMKKQFPNWKRLPKKNEERTCSCYSDPVWWSGLTRFWRERRRKAGEKL